MKRCPTCNRTYTDESLNFCLADGAFLSAPDDPQPTVASPTLRIEQPPTEILPAKSPDAAATSPSPLVITRERTGNKQSLLPWLAAGILAIAFIVYLAIPKGSTSNNPNLNSSNNPSANSDNQASVISESTSSSPSANDRPNDTHIQKPAVASESPRTDAGIGEGDGGGPGPGRGNNGLDYANTIFNSKDVTVKARILSRPEPQYTEEARRNQISGTVVLRAVFTASGQVTDIRAVSGLPYGLTERAIEAARQIRFAPAMKDGHPVSQYIEVEYNFNLY